MPFHRCVLCQRRLAAGQRCPCRGTTTERGYGSSWAQASAAQIRRQPWCSVCGHQGSANNPLTADHVVPKVRGGGDEATNLDTRCRVHNSAKGAR